MFQSSVKTFEELANDPNATIRRAFKWIFFSALISESIFLFITGISSLISLGPGIVGAIVGFAAVGVGFEVVKWGKVGSIVMSWVVSPITAGVISYALFISVQKLILQTDTPLET